MKRMNTQRVWWAAVLLLAGGTAAVFDLAERRIAAQAATNERLVAQLEADSIAVRSRGALLAELGRLRAELRRLGNDEAPVPIVARFVHDAARAAQEHHATIASIAASGSPATPSSRAEPLETIPLAVTVEGRYADVLALIRTLSNRQVPAQIDIVSIVRSDRPGTTAVAAALRVVLQRVAPGATGNVVARRG